MLTQDTAAGVSKFAVVICEVKSTDVSPPTADAGCEIVLPSLVWVRWVWFPTCRLSTRQSASHSSYFSSNDIAVGDSSAP
jgi:hypothetical protein